MSRMGDLADPGTADWMAPDQSTGPQPVAVDPRLRLPARMGDLASMMDYSEASPREAYGAYDKARREEERRAKILGTPMPGQVERPPMIQYTPETLARDRATMELGRDLIVPQTPFDYATMLATPLKGISAGTKIGALALGALFDPGEAQADVGSKVAKAMAKARRMGSLVDPADYSSPAVLSHRAPTPEDLVKIKAAAVQFGRKGWPNAEREVFATTPEAYAETTQLVPQISIKHRLPGPLPGEGLPNKGRADVIVQNTDKIAERIAQRLQPLVETESPLLKFYHTGPVIRGIERYADMNVPEANMFMRDWAGQGAATSPRTQTPPNLRNSSYLMHERARGEPLTPERYAREGNIPGFPMMGMHVDLADKFARGTENLWKNPKPGTFRENWSGNLLDVTGDTHNIRSTLFEMDQVAPGSLPRGWFTSDDAYRKYRTEGFKAVDPSDILDTLGSKTVKKVDRQSEYLPMTEPWYRAAQKLGIHPAEGQSGGWFSYGDITRLQSPPKTIVNLLNDQVDATAKVLNIPPEKVVEWWARGKIPLAGFGGAAMLGNRIGDIAAQDDYR